MKLNPYENGVHSLAKGLESFWEFHENESNQYALKDSVLRSYQGLETIFKTFLFKLNPVLVLKERTKIKKVVKDYENHLKEDNGFLFEDSYTIGLKNAFKRLRKFQVFNSITERELQQVIEAIDELQEFRNKLQHYGLEADIDVIARILGNLIPKCVDAIKDKDPNIEKNLKDIYPKSNKVIKVLRNNYDTLIKEAVNFFKENVFEGKELQIKINDNGNVGASPHLPKISFNKMLTLDLDDKVLMNLKSPQIKNNSNIDLSNYSASINIEKPDFESSEKDSDRGKAEGKISLNASIELFRAKNLFNFLNESKKEFYTCLRNININLQVSLKYYAEVIYNQAHYDVLNLLEASGKLILELTSVPKGFKEKDSKREILGKYEAELNKENAGFDLHTFVLPDKSLSDNYSLKWIVNTKSDFKFK